MSHYAHVHFVSSSRPDPFANRARGQSVDSFTNANSDFDDCVDRA